VPRLAGIARLAEDLPVDVHLGVAGQDRRALHCPRLSEGVFEDDLARIARRQLLDIRRADLELDPELLEDRFALRRGARED
jgi:hypothetical protein